MDTNKVEMRVIETSKVERFNATGLCSEEICPERYTHFADVEVFGMRLLIPLCEAHYEEFNKRWIEE